MDRLDRWMDRWINEEQIEAWTNSQLEKYGQYTGQQANKYIDGLSIICVCICFAGCFDRLAFFDTLMFLVEFNCHFGLSKLFTMVFKCFSEIHWLGNLS